MTTDVRSFFLAAAACVALAVAPLHAQTGSPPPTGEDSATPLSDFAWLEGTWRGTGPGGSVAEIHYMAPSAGVLPSVFRLERAGKVLVLETITLVEEADGLVLYIRHFSPALEAMEKERPLTLRLVDREGDTFFFENVYEENPRRSELERNGPDTFRSWSELLRDDGTTSEIEVEYTRVAEG